MDDAFHYLESRGRNGKHCTVKIPPVGENDLYIENGSSSQALTRGYDEKIPTESKNLPKLLVWSSSDEAGISRLTLVYEKYLSMASLPNSQDTHLENLAYTLSHHRSRLRWKSFLVVDSAEDLQPRLRGGISKPYRTGLPPRISFIFTGQGAQWFAMGRELFASPTFRSSLEAAEQYLRGLGCCWSLKSKLPRLLKSKYTIAKMVTDELLRSEESSKLDNPALSQPICTVLQIALVDLLAIWQIWPSSVIGHSSGEIAAAYCAGGLSRESAYKIAYYRGLLAARIGTDAQDSGAMLSVALSALEAGPYLATVARQYPTAEIAIGCLNSPKNTTITGNERSIDALKAILDREKKFARKLKVGVAYHSRSMNKVGAEYELLIKDLVPGQCQNPTQTLPVMYSSVTGQRIEIEQLSQASYWVENMVSKVNFLGALTQLCTSLRKGLQGKYSMDLLIEIGPHAALRRPIKDTLDTIATSSAVDYDSALLQGISASRTIMEMVGRLYCKGYQLDLIAVNSPGKKTSQLSMLTDIPGYPFNHSQSYWLESRLSKDFRFRKHGRHELLGTPSSDWNPFEAKWRNIIKVDENPWIRDHTVRSLSSKDL